VAEEEGFEPAKQRRGKSRACVQEGKMFIKRSKFYADWRTPDGVRHRRSFDTRLAAVRHENKQKRQNPRMARSAAAVQESPRPHDSDRSQMSLVESQQRRPSRNSTSTTSNSRRQAGRVAARAQGTTTPSNSGRSSKPSPPTALPITVAGSIGQFDRSRAPSGRPKTKHVGVSHAATSDSGGCSPVPWMSACGTRLLSV
jgi:hypothetical protein